MHVSAVKLGMAPDVFTTQQEKISDPGWRLDFGKLYQLAGGNASDVARAALFGSRPPPNDSLSAVAKAKGFEVIVFDRNVKNQEKRVDVAIATEIMADCYERMAPGMDEITLVAGDQDYVTSRFLISGFIVFRYGLVPSANAEPNAGPAVHTAPELSLIVAANSSGTWHTAPG